MTQAFVTQVIEEDGLRASAGSLDANPRSRRNPSSDDSPAKIQQQPRSATLGPASLSTGGFFTAKIFFFPGREAARPRRKENLLLDEIALRDVGQLAEVLGLDLDHDVLAAAADVDLLLLEHPLVDQGA